MMGTAVIPSPARKRTIRPAGEVLPNWTLQRIPERRSLYLDFSGEMTPAKARALATMLTIYADRLEAEVS